MRPALGEDLRSCEDQSRVALHTITHGGQNVGRLGEVGRRRVQERLDVQLRGRDVLGLQPSPAVEARGPRPLLALGKDLAGAEHEHQVAGALRQAFLRDFGRVVGPAAVDQLEHQPVAQVVERRIGGDGQAKVRDGVVHVPRLGVERGSEAQGLPERRPELERAVQVLHGLAEQERVVGAGLGPFDVHEWGRRGDAVTARSRRSRHLRASPLPRAASARSIRRTASLSARSPKVASCASASSHFSIRRSVSIRRSS
jgi:hypothetical protein